MPVRDTNLNLSPQASDLPLIVTNVMSASTVEINGTPITGLAVRVDYGYTCGNTAKLTGTLDVLVHGASSTPVASSDPTVGRLESALVMSSTTAATTGQAIIPFVTDYRYVRCEFALATNAATDSPAWSRVDAYIVENVGKTWTRAIHFDE